MKFKLRSIKGLALLSTFAYQSYSTLAYGFLGENRILRTLMIGITVAICLWALSICKVKTALFSLKVLLVYASVYGTAYLIWPNNRTYIVNIVTDSFIWLFIIVFTYELSARDFILWMSRSSFLILFCNSFEIVHRYVTSQHDGYMVYGMRVMTCAVMFAFLFLATNKRKYLYGFLVSTFLILALGNRSALLICLILFAIGYIRIADSTRKIIRRMVILVLAIGIVLMSINGIISLLVDALDYLGVSSRTLMKLIEGSVAEDNGRYIIWENATEKIREQWLTGYGIAGDRNFVLIGTSTGFYVHNFAFEVLIDFGLILGPILLSIVFFYAFKTIFCTNQRDLYSELFLYVFIATVIKLSFSGSLWTDVMSYWCVAVYLKHRYCTKGEKNV